MKFFLKVPLLGMTLIVLVTGCVSGTARTIPRPEVAQTEFLGTVSDTFTSLQVFNIRNNDAVAKAAYERLLAKAKEEWGPDVDVRNIVIKGGFSGWEILWTVGMTALGAGIGMLIDTAAIEEYNASYERYPNDYSDYETPYEPPAFGFYTGILSGSFFAGALLGGNYQKITATGDIVALSGSPASRTAKGTEAAPTTRSSLDAGIERGAKTLMSSLPKDATIAIISIASEDPVEGDYAVDELTVVLVNAKQYKIVDRKSLDVIRSEQKLQMTGEVDDNSAVSIGQMLGANVVITGTINRRTGKLNLKALDVKTAVILAMASEDL